MIVILADPADAQAAELVGRWQPWGAAMLTPGDLSEPGWRHCLGRPAAGTAVVAGQRVAVTDIEGVLVRLPGIDAQRLVRLAPSERYYAAAEMAAFLTAWLTELECPVLNRPTAGSLCGPGWRPDQWALAARRAGLAAAPVTHRAALDAGRPAAGGPPPQPAGPPVQVTVVTGMARGEADALLLSRTVELARVAGAECLVATFAGEEARAPLVAAHPWVDVSDPWVEERLLRRLAAAERVIAVGA